MTDRQIAFDALDKYRTVMYSDASPEDMVEALDVMVTAVEKLVLDDNVWTMIQSMVDQTSMRVNLICDDLAKTERKEAEMRADTIVRSLKLLERQTRNLLDGCRFYDLQEVQERLKARDEFRERMATLRF